MSVLVATVIVASTPPSLILAFVLYIPMALLFVMTGPAPAHYLAWRCAAASPFLLMAGGLPLLQAVLSASGVEASAPTAVSVVGKGLLAVLLLAFLTATTPLAELLWALRKLGSPGPLNLILGMMYRYTNLLWEEYARMERARDCRTVRPLGWRSLALHGHHVGSLIVRSWDRADRIHAAMLSRGFRGVWPMASHSRFGLGDVLFVASVTGLFLAPRLWL
jgi:cobalt/nickel transport system permease protein